MWMPQSLTYLIRFSQSKDTRRQSTWLTFHCEYIAYFISWLEDWISLKLYFRGIPSSLNISRILLRQPEVTGSGQFKMGATELELRTYNYYLVDSILLKSYRQPSPSYIIVYVCLHLKYFRAILYHSWLIGPHTDNCYPLSKTGNKWRPNFYQADFHCRSRVFDIMFVYILTM